MIAGNATMPQESFTTSSTTNVYKPVPIHIMEINYLINVRIVTQDATYVSLSVMVPAHLVKRTPTTSTTSSLMAQQNVLIHAPLAPILMPLASSVSPVISIAKPASINPKNALHVESPTSESNSS